MQPEDRELDRVDSEMDKLNRALDHVLHMDRAPESLILKLEKRYEELLRLEQEALFGQC